MIESQCSQTGWPNGKQQNGLLNGKQQHTFIQDVILHSAIPIIG